MPSRFEAILTPPSFAARRRSRRTAARRAGYWRWLRFTTDRRAQRRGEDRRRDASDRAGLGDEVQRPWSLWAHRRQGAGPNAAPDERARAALAGMVEDGPIPAVHGVVRWRLVDLCQQMFEAFHVVVWTQTMSRELRAMDGDVRANSPAVPGSC